MIITKLKPAHADAMLDVLSGTGKEGTAAKALRTYRQHQSPATEQAALAALQRLDENSLTACKQAARI